MLRATWLEPDCRFPCPSGFFRKLLKLAFIGAIVAAIVQFVKRRRGQDVDDVEWQELPPPAGDG